MFCFVLDMYCLLQAPLMTIPLPNKVQDQGMLKGCDDVI